MRDSIPVLLILVLCIIIGLVGSILLVHKYKESTQKTENVKETKKVESETKVDIVSLCDPLDEKYKLKLGIVPSVTYILYINVDAIKSLVKNYNLSDENLESNLKQLNGLNYVYAIGNESIIVGIAGKYYDKDVLKQLKKDIKQYNITLHVIDNYFYSDKKYLDELKDLEKKIDYLMIMEIIRNESEYIRILVCSKGTTGYVKFAIKSKDIKEEIGTEDICKYFTKTYYWIGFKAPTKVKKCNYTINEDFIEGKMILENYIPLR